MTSSGSGYRRSVRASALLSKLMLPTSRILTLVMASFALAAPASAADPLLSGYSGPGGGDQAVLGAELLPGPGGGEGSSLEAPARAAEPEAGEAGIAAITAAAPLTPQPAQPRNAGGSPPAGAPGRPPERGQAGRRENRRAAAPVRLAAVTYPASSSDAELLSLPAFLGLLLALAALLGVALGTTRLAGRSVASPGVRS